MECGQAIYSYQTQIMSLLDRKCSTARKKKKKKERKGKRTNFGFRGMANDRIRVYSCNDQQQLSKLRVS
jgi:hypothetical protein